MEFPSFTKFVNGFSDFQKKSSQLINDFRKGHPIMAEFIDSALPLLPYPFDKIGISIMNSSNGSDEEKILAILDYMKQAENRGEEHFRYLKNELANIDETMAKEKTLSLVQQCVLQSKQDIQNITKNIKELSSEVDAIHTATTRKGQLIILNPTMREFDSKDVKEFQFQLTNPGNSTLMVTSIKIQVLDCGLNDKLKMYIPEAPLSVYHYRVELESNKKEYDIVSGIYSENKSSFYYAKGDVDAFSVKLNSTEPYWYEIQLVIEFVDVEESHITHVTSSPTFTIKFSPDHENIIGASS